ncbi:transcriptional regulator [Streptomyces sp. NPDC055186]
MSGIRQRRGTAGKGSIRRSRWTTPSISGCGLGILTIAREADRVEFGFLKKQLTVTDGNLSRHLKVLERSDLITVAKGYVGRRPRMWIALTGEGVQALDAELRALRVLVLRLESPRPAPGTSEA